MATLEEFEKQPGERQDYDITFVEYLQSMNEDATDSHTAEVTAATGITVDSYSVLDGVVKVWVSGGTTGQKYKVTATMTTAGGRVKEADITIKVKES
jgi:hypothetical protein